MNTNYLDTSVVFGHYKGNEYTVIMFNYSVNPLIQQFWPVFNHLIGTKFACGNIGYFANLHCEPSYYEHLFFYSQRGL